MADTKVGDRWDEEVRSGERCPHARRWDDVCSSCGRYGPPVDDVKVPAADTDKVRARIALPWLKKGDRVGNALVLEGPDSDGLLLVEVDLTLLVEVHLTDAEAAMVRRGLVRGYSVSGKVDPKCTR